MAKKTKQPSQKSARKLLVKEIETKITESVKGYHKKVSGKKLVKKIHRAGKMLAKSLTKEQITLVHKKKTKEPKRDKKVADKVVAS